jgi:hypothetical protein
LTRPTRQIHQTLHHAGVDYPGPHGYIAPGGHGPRSSTFSMSYMSSTLPAYQPHAIPYGQQAVHEQLIPALQPPSLVYPVQQLPFHGQAPGGGAAYAMPYSAAFQTPYGQHQQHQPVHFQQSVSGFQYYLPNPPAHRGSAMSGQTPLFGQPYVVQQQYTTTFSQPPQPLQNARMSQQGDVQPQDRQAAYPSAPPPLRKEGEKREAATEYDVSQTIVDGSLFMRSAKPWSNSPGEWCRADRRCLMCCSVPNLRSIRRDAAATI